MRWLRLLFLAWISGLFLWTAGMAWKHQPALSRFVQALLGHLWVLGVVAGLLVSAWALGHILGRWLPLPDAPWNRGLYRAGAGMAGWSLAGLILAVAHLARPGVLQFAWGLIVATGAGYAWKHREALRRDMAALFLSQPRGPVLLAVPGIAFLLALLPPTSFDALMYHLALPERVLRYGGLQPEPVAHFWHLGMSEFVNLWALALRADRAAKVLHLTWAWAAVLLVYHWAREIVGRGAAGLAVGVLLSMPSLPLLASWAYNDYALAFYTLATLYALYRHHRDNHPAWLPWAGMSAGLAASLKYTGLLVPAVGFGLVLVLALHRKQGWKPLLRFFVPALVVAAAWYVRNAVYMGNPFYPFFFGGRGWDPFLARWYARGGSGLGLQVLEWLALPFTTVAGMGAHSYEDARIGPWWLILAPWMVFWGWRWWRKPRAKRRAWAGTAGVFVLAGLGVWLYGVAWSELLRQPRLLYPVLFPLALLAGYALHGLRVWHRPGDLPWRRVARLLLQVGILMAVLEQALVWVQMQGPAYFAGSLSREAYDRRFPPLYGEYLELVRQAPEEARILLLFEPRSYRTVRYVRPDTLLAHWPHALHRHGTPEGALRAWRAQGFTHVLIFWRGARLLYQNPSRYYPQEHWEALQHLSKAMQQVALSSSGAYVLYQIPSMGGSP